MEIEGDTPHHRHPYGVLIIGDETHPMTYDDPGKKMTCRK